MAERLTLPIVGSNVVDERVNRAATPREPRSNSLHQNRWSFRRGELLARPVFCEAQERRMVRVNRYRRFIRIWFRSKNSDG